MNLCKFMGCNFAICHSGQVKTHSVSITRIIYVVPFKQFLIVHPLHPNPSHEDTSQAGLGPPNGLILTFNLQAETHAEALGTRTSTYEFSGNIIQPKAVLVLIETRS